MLVPSVVFQISINFAVVCDKKQRNRVCQPNTRTTANTDWKVLNLETINFQYLKLEYCKLVLTYGGAAILLHELETNAKSTFLRVKLLK